MNYAILINKNNKIKNNYLNRINLITTKDQDNEDVLVEEETYKAYLELQAFLKEQNIDIVIDSAYRSLEHQEELLNEFREKYGEEYTAKYVAPVGTSEHHTGLAIDLSLVVDGKILEDSMDNEIYVNTYKKIHNILHNFGFILRYPQGKEEITGYSYEPWHIRYVGKFISKIIYENNYTLEEYLTNFSGVLVINKPKDVTSFDVVNEISHLFGIKRIGHTGTLDPLAEGVLVVTIGQATKIAELLTAEYKEYEAGVLLGVETDTLDITGKTLNTKIVPVNLDIKQAVNSFKKTYLQEVPIYSAVKVNGKKLYEYARNNEKVELPKKEVTIKEIELLSTDKNTFKFKCLVSKGCYIRSLIRDIAISIDTYATMTSLVRTKQGKFTLAQSNTLEELKQGTYQLYKIEEVLDYPVIKLDKELEYKVLTGQPIKNTFNIIDKVIFINNDNKLLGISSVKEDYLKTWKNFN